MAFTSRTALKVVAFATGIYFIKQYMQGAVCESKVRLDGKVAIITGSNTGIGKANAEDFVLRGAKVYMACRSLERGKAAAKEIKEKTKVDDDKLIVMKLDLGSIASIKQFSEEFHKKETKLHVLVNNAGIFNVPYNKTEDGFEQTFGVNHLGPFLLTNLLMDLIKAAAPSRIVNVAAEFYRFGYINFDDIMGEKSYGSLFAYAQSKLANMLFTRELHERLKGTGVTTYSLHPGVIHTQLQQHTFIFSAPILREITHSIIWLFLKDPWHGAQTQICCAVSEDPAMESGQYYSDCAIKETMSKASNMETARRLWDLSEHLVGIKSRS